MAYLKFCYFLLHIPKFITVILDSGPFPLLLFVQQDVEEREGCREVREEFAVIVYETEERAKFGDIPGSWCFLDSLYLLLSWWVETLIIAGHSNGW